MGTGALPGARLSALTFRLAKDQSPKLPGSVTKIKSNLPIM